MSSKYFKGLIHGKPDIIFTHTGTSEGKEKYYLISKGCIYIVLS
jgi:hypothetical protein